MNCEELKNRQAPLKENYRNDPLKAKATLTAEGHVRVSDQVCEVVSSQSDGSLTAGLHPMAGGDGTGVCSGDLLLQSLVACSGVTLAAVATAMSLDVTSAKIVARGDLDFRGTLGIDRDVPVGFESIRLEFALTGNAAQDEVDKLLKLTDRYCVVLQSIQQSTRVSITCID